MSLRSLVLIGLVLAGVVSADEAAEDVGEAGAEEEMEDEGEVGAPALSEEQIKAVFQKVDKDGDGKVTEADLRVFALAMRLKTAKNYHEEAFADFDRDKDGKVSLKEATMDTVITEEGGEEVVGDHGGYTTVMFEAADKDGDGFLTKEEARGFTNIEHDPAVEAAVAKFEMKRNDKSGDGKLSYEEFLNMHGVEDVEEEVSDEIDQEMKDQAKKERKDSFTFLDRNTDGFLDVEEMREYESGRHWEEQGLALLAGHADEDGDGSITLQELVGAQHQAEFEHRYLVENWAREFQFEL